MTGLLARLVALAIVAAFGTTAACAQGPANTVPVDNVIREQVTGEPYKMYGRRIVFTNWQYVHPGSFNWLDDQGNGVAANRNANIGDWGAHFKTTDTPRGIRITAQPAERRGDIIPKERPWEARSIAVKTLLQDGDTYKLWATCVDAAGQGNACYYESADGQHWTRPNLGLVEYQGSKENNLIPSLPAESVFIDPSAPPEQRYKGIDGDPHQSGAVRRVQEAAAPRLGAACRPPRRRTRSHLRLPRLRLGRRVPLDRSAGHLQRRARRHAEHRHVRRASCKKYVIYSRTWWVAERDPRVAEGQGQVWYAVGRRSIGRTESDIVRQFPAVGDGHDLHFRHAAQRSALHELLHHDPRRSRTATDVPVDLEPGQRRHAADDRGQSQRQAVGLGARAARCWIPASSRHSMAAACSPRPTWSNWRNGDFVLPYSGYRFPHKYPRGHEGFPPNLGYAMWPKGRLIALEAPQVGEFAMVAVVPPGLRLRINAVTRRGGSIRIEACDIHRQPLPGRTFADCRPIIGDQFKSLVTWQGGEDLGMQPGEAVVLRFQLDQAKIFALDFE